MASPASPLPAQVPAESDSLPANARQEHGFASSPGDANSFGSRLGSKRSQQQMKSNSSPLILPGKQTSYMRKRDADRAKLAQPG
jgi:hypothetical protein